MLLSMFLRGSIFHAGREGNRKSGGLPKSNLLILAAALCLPAVSPAASISTTPSPAAINLVPGITLQDTATLSGFSSFPSSLTFTLFFNGGATPVDTETAGVTGNGQVSTPIGFTLPNTGTVIGAYQWFVNFAGILAGPEDVTVNPGSPAIVTTANPQNVTWNGSPVTLTDRADIESGYNPHGTLTFTLFFNGGSTPVDTETISVFGDGSYSTPSGFTLPTTGALMGTYEWLAAYSGDSNNDAVSTTLGSEPVVVGLPAVVPEPSGIVLWGIGLALVGRRAFLRR